MRSSPDLPGPRLALPLAHLELVEAERRDGILSGAVLSTLDFPAEEFLGEPLQAAWPRSRSLLLAVGRVARRVPHVALGVLEHERLEIVMNCVPDDGALVEELSDFRLDAAER